MPEPKLFPFPAVEIYREDIDGFWFPTYGYADEELILASGYSVRVRIRVRFGEFEKAPRN
jgi:hypothetical protein